MNPNNISSTLSENNKTDAAVVRQVLTCLPLLDRICLLLRIQAGLSLPEIAEVLEKSEKNVSIYLRHGYDQFLKLYNSYTSVKRPEIASSQREEAAKGIPLSSSCKWREQLLVALTDDLSGSVPSPFAQHISSCHICLDIYRGYLFVNNCISSLSTSGFSTSLLPYLPPEQGTLQKGAEPHAQGVIIDEMLFPFSNRQGGNIPEPMMTRSVPLPEIRADKQGIAPHMAEELKGKKSYLFSEEDWGNLYLALKPRIANWVYTSRVPTWTRQRDSIIEDLVQETLLKTIVYAKRTASGIVRLIDSLENISVTIAYHCFTDLRRQDLRVLPLRQDQSEATECEVREGDEDPSEQTIDNIQYELLFIQAARWIVHLPEKQRTALLIDLANRMYIDPLQPTPLQEALASVGIAIRDYQKPLPHDRQARARHAAHLSLAYKRLASLAYMQRYTIVA